MRKPDFNRLLTTLRCGQADAIPVIELGVHPVIKGEILGRQWAGLADDVEFAQTMGYDYVKLQPRFPMAAQRKTAASGPTEGSKQVDRAWASEGEGIVTDWESFEAYPWPKKEDIDYSGFEKIVPLLPEGLGVIGQYGDIFTTTWELMGFEEFSLALYEDPELVEAIFTRVGDLVLSMFETMADMEVVGAMWYSDDIAYTGGLLVSPQVLRQHFFPRLGRIGEFARKAGKPFLYHTDGVLKTVMDDILGAGVSALHPIEPLSIDIVEFKREMAGKLCLCGNIDVDLLARGTPDQVADLVRRRIRDVGPGGGYALGSSNSIPEYVKVENYRTMVQVAIEEGSYN